MTEPARPPSPSPRRFGGGGLRVGPWLLVLLALTLAWVLVDVLMLVFAALLFALILRAMALPLERRAGLSPRLSLPLVLVVLVLVVGGAIGLAGAGAVEQMQALRDTLPRAWTAFQRWLADYTTGRWLQELWASAKPFEDWSRLAGLATGTINAATGAIGAAVLLVVLGIYLAADPGTYRNGLLKLVPRGRRELVARTLEAAGRDLSRWLLGQAVSMLLVGAMTGIGLALIGMPLLLSLSLIAGLLEFVPYFGPIISGVLIVGVALAEGEGLALQALVVCVAVQQAEGYVVQPLVQRWAVRLPPVLGMCSVLVFGVLFGLPGVLLAMPLMVLTMTLVAELYVKTVIEPGR
ncbi:AI-2E family transporter [Rubrivivax gelatinosus]|nr:AI-2E family transporter [Rubrivivax gelatinosus]